MRLFKNWLRREKPNPNTPEKDYLDTCLLKFSPVDEFTIRHACSGIQIFGETGSGKTSGSGSHIARSFLRQGFGGLVLTAKKDERSLWERYCQQTGRENDLLILSPREDLRFNFMNYELTASSEGAGLTENLVSLFTTVLEAGEKSKSKTGEAYWQNTLKQLLRNVIDLISLSGETLSVPLLNEVIHSTPIYPGQVSDQAWQAESLCFQLIQKAQGHADHTRSNDLTITAKYFLKELPGLAEKTRSIIMSSFTSLADSFLRGTMRELFCATTNLTPEDSFNGKIILLDLPIKEFADIGTYAQVLFKYQWQRAVERREIKPNTQPVFLWADEAQFFYHKGDQSFQTTARSARACTVYLTQNLPNYLSAIGDGNRSEIDSFLGNLSTKIFHCNGDAKTNEYSANVFSKDLNYRTSFSAKANQGQGVNLNSNIDFQVEPIEFSKLAKGGPENDFFVQAIVFQGGRTWKATNTNYLPTSFKQL